MPGRISDQIIEQVRHANDVVDVSGAALDRARIGSYPAFQLRDLSTAQRDRWFTRESDRWIVRPALRAGLRFLQHNLLNPLPLSCLDAVFCRNVLIYFQSGQVASCLREIHAILRPGGFLFIGHSESALGFPELFEPMQVRDGVIYRNKLSRFSFS